MDRDALHRWLDDYERAWRTASTEPLRELFTEDASYSSGPYDEPQQGLAAITAFWDEAREGPDEVFTMTREIVAVEGDTCVVRVEVRYGDPVEQEYRDLWIVVLDADGRCSRFEEWPFFPQQPLTADAAR